MRVAWPIVLLLAATLASGPVSSRQAWSEEMGTATSRVPSNPFASNYASEPPVSARGRPRPGARTPSRDPYPAEGLVPPGDVPGAGRGR